MRNLILLLSVVLLSTLAFAQKNKRLMGPAYKNAKPSEKYGITTNQSAIKSSNNSRITSFVVERSKLKGPAYKNFKHSWKDYGDYTVTRTKRSRLMGPAYKNAKPSEKY